MDAIKIRNLVLLLTQQALPCKLSSVRIEIQLAQLVEHELVNSNQD